MGAKNKDGRSDSDADSDSSAGRANICTGLFGIVAYVYMFYVLVFMAAGFMINVGVEVFEDLKPYFPYSIDYNPDYVNGYGLWARVGLDVLLAGFFVIPHSICARPAVKEKLACFGAGYRTFYVMMSSFQLHCLEIYWQPLDVSELGLPNVIWETTGTARTVLLCIYLFGYLWLLTSTFAIDHTDLFGLKQGLGIDLYEMLGINCEDAVARRCHYGIVRHPIMLGFFIMFFFVPRMTFTHLFFSVACTAYCVLAVMFLEEPDLAAALGEAYEEYANEVPAFCPFAPVLCKKKGIGGGSDDDSSE